MDTIIFQIGDKVSVLDEDMQGVVVLSESDVIQIEDENGFSYTYNKKELIKLEDNLLDSIKIRRNKKSASKLKKQVKKIKKQQIEVDLHIHQITHSNKYMSNASMLQKQMGVVKFELQKAMKNNIQKIIFIHGVGQGVLKKEIISFLTQYPVEINDASYSKYGRGATEVYIYKSKMAKI